jgi:hypothetical protein
MEYRNQTWSVVCTARAPEHIINSFIKHYASLNPDKIYIFFDDHNFASYDQHIAPGKLYLSSAMIHTGPPFRRSTLPKTRELDQRA